MIRIIGGRWRRRTIQVLPGSEVRPTSDRLRETLFNWLGTDVIGAHVLDAFAGSGALGLEALSRGAAWATFFEKSHAVVRCLKKNIEALGAKQQTTVYRGDAAYLLSQTPTMLYKGVFFDPPFSHMQLTLLLASFLQQPWFEWNSWIYIEQPYPCLLAVQEVESWYLDKQTRVGQVHGLLYRRKVG